MGAHIVGFVAITFALMVIYPKFFLALAALAITGWLLQFIASMFE